MDNVSEEEIYPVVKEKLEVLIRKKYTKDFHLEITARKHFSNDLKSKISDDRNLIFSFLKDAPPDITGYVKNESISYLPRFFDNKYCFIVVEIKNEKMKLDDIYQLRKYSELFDTWLALLITTKEIPEEIKRLSKINKQLLPKRDQSYTILAQFSLHNNDFMEWFPRNPFK